MLCFQYGPPFLIQTVAWNFLPKKRLAERAVWAVVLRTAAPVTSRRSIISAFISRRCLQC